MQVNKVYAELGYTRTRNYQSESKRIGLGADLAEGEDAAECVKRLQQHVNEFGQDPTDYDDPEPSVDPDEVFRKSLTENDIDGIFVEPISEFEDYIVEVTKGDCIDTLLGATKEIVSRIEFELENDDPQFPVDYVYIHWLRHLMDGIELRIQELLPTGEAGEFLGLSKQVNGIVAAIRKMPGAKVVRLLSPQSFNNCLTIDPSRGVEFGNEIGRFAGFAANLRIAMSNGSLIVWRSLPTFFEYEGKIIPEKIIYGAVFREGMILPLAPGLLREFCETTAETGEPIDPRPGVEYGSFADFLE